jgi:hypothetical protein
VFNKEKSGRRGAKKKRICLMQGKLASMAVWLIEPPFLFVTPNSSLESNCRK